LYRHEFSIIFSTVQPLSLAESPWLFQVITADRAAALAVWSTVLLNVSDGPGFTTGCSKAFCKVGANYSNFSPLSQFMVYGYLWSFMVQKKALVDGVNLNQQTHIGMPGQ
jgi:hypothetical protein